MKTSKTTSKWMYLVATLMFAAATLHIVSDRYILGAVFFAAAACFSAAATLYKRKAQAEEKREETDAEQGAKS